MAFNFQQLALIQKVKPLIDTFRIEHPKFGLFLNAVRQDAVRKDSIIEITVTSPEGKSYTTNIKLTENDLELLEMMKTFQKGT